MHTCCGLWQTRHTYSSSLFKALERTLKFIIHCSALVFNFSSEFGVYCTILMIFFLRCFWWRLPARYININIILDKPEWRQCQRATKYFKHYFRVFKHILFLCLLFVYLQLLVNYILFIITCWAIWERERQRQCENGVAFVIFDVRVLDLNLPRNSYHVALWF